MRQKDLFIAVVQAAFETEGLEDWEKFDLSLVEIIRIAVEKTGSMELALLYLSEHLKRAVSFLEEEAWKVSLH